MKCSADNCGTGVPPGRPFCTHHMGYLPYRITKNFWHSDTKADAVAEGITYLRLLEMK